MSSIKRNKLQWDSSDYRLSICPVIERIDYQWISSIYKCGLALNMIAKEI